MTQKHIPNLCKVDKYVRSSIWPYECMSQIQSIDHIEQFAQMSRNRIGEQTRFFDQNANAYDPGICGKNQIGKSRIVVPRSYRTISERTPPGRNKDMMTCWRLSLAQLIFIIFSCLAHKSSKQTRKLEDFVRFEAIYWELISLSPDYHTISVLWIRGIASANREGQYSAGISVRYNVPAKFS